MFRRSSLAVQRHLPRPEKVHPALLDPPKGTDELAAADAVIRNELWQMMDHGEDSLHFPHLLFFCCDVFCQIETAGVFSCAQMWKPSPHPRLPRNGVLLASVVLWNHSRFWRHPCWRMFVCRGFSVLPHASLHCWQRPSSELYSLWMPYTCRPKFWWRINGRSCSRTESWMASPAGSIRRCGRTPTGLV